MGVARPVVTHANSGRRRQSIAPKTSRQPVFGRCRVMAAGWWVTTPASRAAVKEPAPLLSDTAIFRGRPHHAQRRGNLGEMAPSGQRLRVHVVRWNLSCTPQRLQSRKRCEPGWCSSPSPSRPTRARAGWRRCAGCRQGGSRRTRRDWQTCGPSWSGTCGHGLPGAVSPLSDGRRRSGAPATGATFTLRLAAGARMRRPSGASSRSGWRWPYAAMLRPGFRAACCDGLAPGTGPRGALCITSAAPQARGDGLPIASRLRWNTAERPLGFVVLGAVWRSAGLGFGKQE